MIGLIVLFCLGIISLLFVVVGMGMYDLSDIRAKRRIKRHPNARSLRSRPVVHMVIHGEATQHCLESIRKNVYKKLVVTNEYDSIPYDGLVMHIEGNDRLEKNSIREAVQLLLVDNDRRSVTVTPIIRFGLDTMGLFRTYASLARLPFIAARSGFSMNSRRNMLSRDSVPHKRFYLAVIAFKVINLVLFIYACYAAAELRQPEIVLTYISVLGFWLAWSILRYPYFSVFKKTVLLLLSPMSFVYFVYLVIAAPFTSVGKQTTRQNDMINT